MRINFQKKLGLGYKMFNFGKIFSSIVWYFIQYEIRSASAIIIPSFYAVLVKTITSNATIATTTTITNTYTILFSDASYIVRGVSTYQDVCLCVCFSGHLNRFG